MKLHETTCVCNVQIYKVLNYEVVPLCIELSGKYKAKLVTAFLGLGVEH